MKAASVGMPRCVIQRRVAVDVVGGADLGSGFHKDSYRIHLILDHGQVERSHPGHRHRTNVNTERYKQTDQFRALNGVMQRPVTNQILRFQIGTAFFDKQFC